MPVRIVIADDHEAVRGGIKSLLSRRSDWLVCGEAADGCVAVELARELRPDVILMDISMPRMDGIEATRIVRRELPESIVVIVSQNDPAVVSRLAREIGASDSVAKSNLASDLIPVIQKTLASRERARANEPEPPQPHFIGGGEMGERIRSFDWSKTVLGPIHHWPEPLKTAVRICIGSRNPIVLWWGRSALSQFYNDAYISFLGSKKHPAFLGGSARECWSEIWETMGPMLDHVFETGDATWSEDFLYVLNRNLPREEGYFTFSYSPIRNDAGIVEGIFCACYETTARVIGDRRLRTLGDLGRAVSTAGTADEAFQSAAYSYDGAARRGITPPCREGGTPTPGKAELARQAVRQSEERFRKLAETLDAEVRIRTRELEKRNAEFLNQSEQLRDLSSQLLHAQDKERRHIARELHDGAGQTLALLGLTLGRLAKNSEGQRPELRELLDEANDLVQELTKEIRTMSYLLHPPTLDLSGLNATLSWYVGGFAERSGINAEFKIAEDFGRLPRDMELTIFRLVQECLTNIHRHSGSKTAEIHILREPLRVLIEVLDQGRGIPAEKLAEVQTRGLGVGIRGMRERLRQFRGELKINSTNLGTSVLVTIPIPEELRDAG